MRDRLSPDTMNRFKRAVRVGKPEAVPRIGDDSLSDDELQASMNRHPSGGDNTLAGWARALQGQADEVGNAHRLDEARQPQPDTVGVMGRFVVGEAGGDRDRQMEVATELIKVTKPLHRFVEDYITEDNAKLFVKVVQSIVDEKFMQDNE